MRRGLLDGFWRSHFHGETREKSRLQHAVVLFFDSLSEDSIDVEDSTPDRGFLACGVRLT